MFEYSRPLLKKGLQEVSLVFGLFKPNCALRSGLANGLFYGTTCDLTANKFLRNSSRDADVKDNTLLNTADYFYIKLFDPGKGMQHHSYTTVITLPKASDYGGDCVNICLALFVYIILLGCG